MRIIIAEGGPAENVGSMALIENAIKIARMKFPESDLIVLTPTVPSVENSLKMDGVNGVKVLEDLFVPPPSKNSTFKKLLWLTSSLVWIFFVRFIQVLKISPCIVSTGNRKKVLLEVKDADYIFCIGAERINDVFYKTVFLSLEALSIYQRMGKKMIHLSMTIGPLYYKFSMRKASKVLNNSHAVFVRDQISFDWLSKLNVTKPLIYNSYDIAILQDKNTSSNQLLSEFKISEGFIGVSFIEWAFRKVEGPVRMEGYTKAIAETLDYLIEKYHQQIVFIPTVVNAKSYKVDDVEACKRLKELVKNKDRVSIIERLLSPGEMATLFSYCKYSLVTRMHAAILCSGAGGRPIITINYLYKLREFMKNMEIENLSIDIDYINSKDLIALVESLNVNYDEYLSKNNLRMKQLQSKLLFDINKCFNSN